MPVNGSNPLQSGIRAYGHATLPVSNVRTQSLQPGQLVLFKGKKHTVLAVSKTSEGWFVQLRAPKGQLVTTTRAAGHTWPVVQDA